jgi:hypothetical protein
MSTNGFVIFIADGQSKSSYNHWDSGPRDLGVKVLEWLRSSTSTPDRARSLCQRIMLLRVVSDEDALPTEAQRQDLAIYAEQTGGGEWYSLLRATQGEPEKILECGYVVDEGDLYGWQYIINADAETFSVDWGDGRATSWPWSDLPNGNALIALAEQYEEEDDDEPEPD